MVSRSTTAFTFTAAKKKFSFKVDLPQQAQARGHSRFGLGCSAITKNLGMVVPFATIQTVMFRASQKRHSTHFPAKFVSRATSCFQIAVRKAFIGLLLVSTGPHSGLADVIRFDGRSLGNPASSIVRFGFTDLDNGPIKLAVPASRAATRVGRLKSITPSKAVMSDIRRVAQRYERAKALADVNLSPSHWALFLQAMIRVESAYVHSAKSHVGAIGLAQLMPGTAKELNVDPYNQLQNLDGGARYLLAQIKKFGSLELALAAYNAGPGAVGRYGGIPPYPETQSHVVKVMREFARLQSKS